MNNQGSLKRKFIHPIWDSKNDVFGPMVFINDKINVGAPRGILKYDNRMTSPRTETQKSIT